VYDFNPCAPIDLFPLPPSKTTCFDASHWSEFIFKMHETTKLNIEKMKNEKYQIAGSKGWREVKLEPGDLVWLDLRKEWFPNLKKSKLMFHADSPFKILERINDNAYKVELPSEFGVSPTFDISDLRPYLGEEDEVPSRTTSNQEGGGWWGHHYIGYNHFFYWGAWTNYEITSTTTTSSGKFVLMFIH
jgi:hypothetical protein